MTIEECLENDTPLVMIKEERKRKKKEEEQPIIYKKPFNHAEFIGESLCKRREIKCATFFLSAYVPYKVSKIEKYGRIKKYHPIIWISSFDFKKEGKAYFHGTGKPGQTGGCLNRVLGLTPTKKNQEELLDEIEEILALDTYMGQTDRHERNIIFEEDKKTKEIHLAPVFDFEYSLKSSYLDPNKIYENAIYPLRNLEDYKAFLEKHEKMREKLKYYLELSMPQIVKESFEEHGLTIPEEKIPFYKDFDKNRKELIRKILR